jgi:hypothetical protein
VYGIESEQYKLSLKENIISQPLMTMTESDQAAVFRAQPWMQQEMEEWIDPARVTAMKKQLLKKRELHARAL